MSTNNMSPNNTHTTNTDTTNTATTNTHVVIGAGATGSATAELLATQGRQVRIITRSGSGPAHPSIERVAADASDPAALASLTADAAVIYNCANPAYHEWTEVWPPLAASILHAAEVNDAVLVTLSNLYGYAEASSPMRPSDPLDPPSIKGGVRVAMWNEAKAAHDAGRVRITEARASDFIGPGVGDNGRLADRVVPRILKGKSVSLLGNLDMAHSWTAISDVARTLVTLGADERAWGRAWHVPTVEPLTQRELVHHMCARAGVDPVSIKVLPSFAVTLAGLAMPVMRELKEVAYQFEAPFVLDSSETTSVFGLEPTPLDDTVDATIASYQAPAVAAAA